MPLDKPERKPEKKPAKKPMQIGARPSLAVQRYLRNREEYPNGPYGTRVVNVTIAAERLDPANCRPKQRLDRQIVETVAECRYLDDQIARYTRSLWAISRYKHASRVHYNAYLDLIEQLGDLKLKRNGSASRRIKLQAALQQIAYRFRSPRKTQVIWYVHNHLRRTYVPTSYLQQRALAYVLDNPAVIGTTVQLNF
jgi:hypothetical protein